MWPVLEYSLSVVSVLRKLPKCTTAREQEQLLLLSYRARKVRLALLRLDMVRL